MTERLWSKYDISRKSPELPVKRSPIVAEEGEGTCTERTVGFPLWLAEKYTSWWGSCIFRLL